MIAWVSAVLPIGPVPAAFQVVFVSVMMIVLPPATTSASVIDAVAVPVIAAEISATSA